MTTESGPLRPLRPEPRPLAQVVRGLGLAGDPAAVAVTGAASRAQHVRPGDLFAALPGARTHGASFAAEAHARGAVAVLTDADGAADAAATGLPVLVADDVRAVLGAVAARVHGTDTARPRLLGVTGTNGKSTTVHALAVLAERLGAAAGVSSTAERGAGDDRRPAGLTTPEADELHALLARFREDGVATAAVEVSAQALVRHRVDGLVFDVVGFTNLTHDHLDDFGTMDRYFAAKAALFEPERAAAAVVTVDGDAGRELVRRARIPVATLGTGRRSAADWRVHDVRSRADGTRFSLIGPDGALTTRVPMTGAHQAVDAGLAIAMTVAGGVPFEAVAAALDGAALPVRLPGRLERVPGSVDPAIWLDVAHTPDAFAAALRALRPITPGRLVIAFGADGDRDASKRGPMGRTAARLADAVVVHDHHSRTEDPDRIRRAVLEGARGGPAEVLEVRDPAEALRVAATAAGAGGAVLWAGTGRTAYRDVGGVKRPWSFWDEAVRLVQERAAGPGSRRIA